MAACKIEKGRNGDIAAAVRKHFNMVPTSMITPNSHIQGLYVGISAIDCLPIIMVKGPEWKDGAENTDNLDCVKLLSQSGEPIGGRDIIWLENMLIPGNLGYLKGALWNVLPNSERRHLLTLTSATTAFWKVG